MIYLLHFDRPFKHARHYIGWTQNLEERLAAHRAGARRAGRLVQVAAAAGIAFRLARTWDRERGYEVRLKKQGGASRCCPICHAEGLRAPRRRSA